MIGLGSAALLLCSIYLLIAITRQFRRLSKSESSLLRTSQQLDAALNNMAHGISMFDQRTAAGRRQQAIRGHVQSHARPGEAGHAGARYSRRPRGGRRLAGVTQLRGRPHQGHVGGQGLFHHRPSARRARHRHQPSAHGQRRLGRGPSGHHRAEARRGRARAYGALRRPDRPRQSRAVPGEGERGAGAHGKPWRAVLGADARPRPLQGGQRLARTCDRRLAPEGGRRAACAGWCATSMSSRGLAATNSRSSRSPTPTSAIRSTVLANRILSASPSPTTSMDARSSSAPRSASRWRRRTPTTPTRSCATPTSRSTRRNPRAATAIASSRPPWRRRRATAASSKRTCGARCCATNSSCTTRPSSTSAGASAAAPRRWCAGAIRSAACCSPTSSSAWRRKAA